MTTTYDDEADLNTLRRQYQLGTLELETPQGRRWRRRVDEDSEHYFKQYSRKWTENRALLVDFEKMIDQYGTYVAIAYPIIQNFISDMYFHNPDPFIQDKGGDNALGRILTDVARSVHAECDTEAEMQHCFQDQSWAGFGMMVGSFRQQPSNAGDSIIVATGGINPDGSAEMKDSGEIVPPTSQKIIVQRLSPWRCRFDPKGRRWDMSDHLWWGFDSYAYLGPLMRDSRLTDEDKRRLMADYSSGKGKAYTIESASEESSPSGYIEKDPEFIRVLMRTIWSRTDYKVYRKPFGAGFTFEPQDWDEEWKNADRFPCVYMPRNRVPEDQKNTEGFIGVPDLALIKPHIENINKEQGLLVSALEHVIDVYATFKGALDNVSVGKVEDAGRMWKIIQFDPECLKKYPTQQQDAPIKWDDILHLLPTGDTKDMQHMAAIDHEFGLIAQIMGQGPADRGGVTASKTATESLGVQQGLSRRMSTNRNTAGKYYNAVTKMIFLIMQARHTLPLRYQMTGPFNQKTWDTFVNPVGTLKNVDLHFEYATGSTEPQTREQAFALRERMATILMPIFQNMQDTRRMLKVAQELIEPLNILDADSYFDDAASQIVMQLMTILYGLGNGKIGDIEITPDNEKVIQQIPELLSKLAPIILTPSQLAQVAAIVKGAAPQPQDQAPQQQGSLPAAPSPGEADYAAGAAGSAAAGANAGIQFREQLPSAPPGYPS